MRNEISGIREDAVLSHLLTQATVENQPSQASKDQWPDAASQSGVITADKHSATFEVTNTHTSQVRAGISASQVEQTLDDLDIANSNWQ